MRRALATLKAVPGPRSPLKNSNLATELYNRINREMRNTARDFLAPDAYSDDLYFNISKLQAHLSSKEEVRSSHVDVDLYALLVGYLPYDKKQEVLSEDEKEIREDLEFRVSIMRAFYDRFTTRDNLSGIELDIKFLQHYFIEFWRGFAASPERVAKENEFLWKEILDNPNWFVSPRGDRYLMEKDPWLKDQGIRSVVYNIDRRFPREHLIGVMISDIDYPFRFWLDTHRNLLGKEHQWLTSLDPFARQAFTNLLLRRLYLITSGLLASDSSIVTPGGEEGSWVDYRRAHYRHLFSTGSRPITLQSHGAILHADEIRRGYGIDIYKEIERRRKIETLKPNEFITFVREVIPEFMSDVVVPNDLTYDPTLIRITA